MKDTVIRLRITGAEHEELRTRAEEQTGGNMSELIRRLLWPKNEQPPPKAQADNGRPQ